MKMPWRPIGFTLLAVGAFAGCSSGDSTLCLSADGADVCITGSDGDLQVDATGLEPGSTLRLTSDKLGEVEYEISSTGAPAGQIGMLGDLRGEVVSISAIAASGETIDGDITVGE